MKQLQNNYTTPEQSKRLLELGVPADSADCIYSKMKHENKYSKLRILHEGDMYLYSVAASFHPGVYDYLPCWSVGQLIEIYNECADAGNGVNIPPNHIVLQRVLIDFFAAAKYGKLDFSKLEE